MRGLSSATRGPDNVVNATAVYREASKVVDPDHT